MQDEILASRRLMAVLQRLPSFSVLMLKYNNTFWRYLTEIIRGELTYPDLPRKLGPLQHLLNRWGDHEPQGRMYALESAVEAVRAEERRNADARTATATNGAAADPAASVGLQGDGHFGAA